MKQTKILAETLGLMFVAMVFLIVAVYLSYILIPIILISAIGFIYYTAKDSSLP